MTRKSKEAYIMSKIGELEMEITVSIASSFATDFFFKDVFVSIFLFSTRQVGGKSGTALRTSRAWKLVA